jgi:hypothetical protein
MRLELTASGHTSQLDDLYLSTRLASRFCHRLPAHSMIQLPRNLTTGYLSMSLVIHTGSIPKLLQSLRIRSSCSRTIP